MRYKPLVTIILAVILIGQVGALHSAYPMPVASIQVREDLSATLKASVYRTLSEDETFFYTNTLKAPILNWMNFRGNLTMNQTPAGLRGTYRFIFYPQAGDPTNRANFLKRAVSLGYLSNSTLLDMMTFFYGKNFLILYGLRWNFFNVTYRSVPDINFTGIVTLASASSNIGRIKSLSVSYTSEILEATGTLVVSYEIYAETLPLELKKSSSGDYYLLDLSPLTYLLPDDIACNLWVNFTIASIQIMGANIAPKVILWNNALWEFVPQLQKDGKSLTVVVKRAEVYVTPQLILLASIPPIVVGSYIFWRIRSGSLKVKGKLKE
ncbi:MAG: hypothetical protein NZ992_03435 [Candidatus Korarchaeum sp.]|nr:hypothetical protein [Candidatus Korarchaeum sp.]MDW8036375.1 hypothetical protein [Candidatus Korarchaeum sp.]